jgi:hypothetical protein
MLEAMKRAVLLLVAACQANADDYPIGPGGRGPIGQGPGNGGDGDGGVDDGGDGGDGDAGVRMIGRVCLLSDLRSPTACDNTQNALGLRVSIGGRTTTTTDRAGSFTINAPLGAGFIWHVDGRSDEDIVRSAMPLGTDNTTIPAITLARYEDLLGSNSATVAPLQGSIVVRVLNGVAPVAQVDAALVGQDVVFYDDRDSRDVWNSGTVGTGPRGVVWMPGVELPLSATPLEITLTPTGGAQAVKTSVLVEDQTITFVTRDLVSN